MLVLGPVVDQQEQSRAGNALDQAVEKRLRLSIDPVQVFEHRDDRLRLTLAQEQSLEAVERKVATLRLVQSSPCPFVHGHVDQGQQGRKIWLQGPVEGQELPRDLLADTPGIVARLDPKVFAQEMSDRLIGSGFRIGYIGYCGALEEQPVMDPVGTGELPEQSRLAEARFPHDSNDLAPARPGQLESVPQLVQLGIAPDEPREASRRARCFGVYDSGEAKRG
jgi:hypothetical protein